MALLRLVPPTGAQPRNGGTLLLAAPDRAARVLAYEEHVFPFAAAAMWATRTDAPSADLLIVPIGTQPYSPLLAILATPATRVALLVTEPQRDGDVVRSPGSRPTADRVRDTLAGGLPDRTDVRVEMFGIGDGNDGAAVARAVGAAAAWAGDPWPLDVTVDVSGGRKSTTAALGGIAAALGYRTAYLEGRHVVDGFYVDERRFALADVASIVHAERRAAATMLLEAGAFPEAAAAFAEIVDSTIAGPGAVLLFELAEALASRQPADVARLLERLPPDSHPAVALRTPHASNVALARSFVDALRQDGAWRC